METIKRSIMIVLVVILSFNINIVVYGQENEYIDIDNTYETSRTVSKGVIYRNQKFFTPKGGIEAHILEVDVNNKNIVLEVLYNTSEIGKRDKLTNLMNKSDGIVAAINGDFFGMASIYGTHTGEMVTSDGLYSLTNNFNTTKNSNYSFGVTDIGELFIECFTTKISLETELGDALSVAALNKVTQFDYPIAIQADYLSNTKVLDNRISGLIKVVVENGRIKNITEPGEVVDVPFGEQSYIIILNNNSKNFISNLYVGEYVNLKYEKNTFLDSIGTMITGSGVILKDGLYIENGGDIVQPNSRHPRSIVGYNRNKTKMYMVVIDGRGNSIGATNKETAGILLANGIYNAMHLDGGASSTLAINEFYKNSSNVLNKPSDGSQRAIANGLGIKNTSEIQETSILQVDVSQTRIFKDIPVDISVTAADENYNKVTPKENISYIVSGISGEVKDNKLYLYSEGKGTVAVTADGITEIVPIECVGDPIRYDITDGFVTWKGKSTAITIKAIGNDGLEQDVTKLFQIVSIDNEEVGVVENGIFVAKEDGECKIVYTYNNIWKQVVVGVGYDIQKIADFEETDINENFVPTDFRATLTYDMEFAYVNSQALKITNIQSKKNIFLKNTIIDRQADTLTMWLKSAIPTNVTMTIGLIDTNGKETQLTVPNLSENRYKQYRVSLPKEIAYPATVNFISFDTMEADIQGLDAIWIDNVNTVTTRKPVRLYDYSLIRDYKNKVSDIKDKTMEISFYGNTLDDGSMHQNAISDKMKTSYISFYGNKTKFSKNNYGFSYNYEKLGKLWQIDYAYIVSLSLANGSLSNTDSNQLELIKNLTKLRNKNIVIYSDINPLNTSNKLELGMIDEVLKNAALNNRIIVIYQGNETALRRISQVGIRYFEVDSITKDEDPFATKVLKMTFSMDDFTYQISEVK